MKRALSEVGATQSTHPRGGDVALIGGGPSIQSDRIKKARQHDISRKERLAVAYLEFRGDQADGLFNIPDGFTGAPLPPEKPDGICVRLGVVAGKQTQQGGFPEPLGPRMAQFSPARTVQFRLLMTIRPS